MRQKHACGAAILSTHCSNPTEFAWCSQINKNEPRILLLQRGSTAPVFPEHWAFPAGILDSNETVLEAVAREVAEEIGIIFHPEKSIFESVWNDRILSYYVGGWEAPEMLQVQADEISGYGWFSFEAALRLPLAVRYAEVIQILAQQY